MMKKIYLNGEYIEMTEEEFSKYAFKIPKKENLPTIEERMAALEQAFTNFVLEVMSE